MHKLTSFKLIILLVVSALHMSTAWARTYYCTIYNSSTEPWVITGHGTHQTGMWIDEVRFSHCAAMIRKGGCTIPPNGQISVTYVGELTIGHQPSGIMILTDKNGTSHDFKFGGQNNDIHLDGPDNSNVIVLNQPRNGDISIYGDQY